MTEAARQLPHSIEAEQALLGLVMCDNSALERLPENLRGDHFHEPFHGRLFDRILTVVASGVMAEPRILSAQMADDPALPQFGGQVFLIDLMDKAPPSYTANSYGRTIYDLALRRDLIRLGEELAGGADDMSMTALEHLGRVEDALFTLAETGEASKGILPFSDALSEAMDMAAAAYQRDGKLAGLATDLTDLDQKLGGLHPSDLLILAGRPSMGKTALATNIAFNVARIWKGVPCEDSPGGFKTKAGGRVLFFSLEMSAAQLATRIIADRSGVSGDRIRKGQITQADYSRMSDVRAEIAAIPLHIDATGGLSIGKLCARARRAHRKHGLDLIVVDYLQLITTGASNGRSRVQEVSEITCALKALAKELGVPVLALSQLSRQVETRPDKRPMLSDLRESGSIEQDADCVMFVFREAYYLERTEPQAGSEEHLKWADDMDRLRNVAEVIIGKQRHGPIGTVRLSFDADTTRFGNLAPDGQSARFYGGGE